MKWPIDAAILMFENKREEDYENIIILLNHIAEKLDLGSTDSEQLSVAVRLVKNRYESFMNKDTLESVKVTFLATEEGRKFDEALKEIISTQAESV